MRPISLFTANGSNGIDTARAFGPDDARSVTVTLAELALGNTLPNPGPYVSGPIGVIDEFIIAYRGFRLITAPVARSIVSISFDTDAGTSREWWKSSMDEPPMIGS